MTHTIDSKNQHIDIIKLMSSMKEHKFVLHNRYVVRDCISTITEFSVDMFNTKILPSNDVDANPNYIAYDYESTLKYAKMQWYSIYTENPDSFNQFPVHVINKNNSTESEILLEDKDINRIIITNDPRILMRTYHSIFILPSKKEFVDRNQKYKWTHENEYRDLIDYAMMSKVLIISDENINGIHMR